MVDFLDSKNILGSFFFLRDSIPSFFWEHERVGSWNISTGAGVGSEN